MGSFFYKGYGCIHRLIISVQRNLYFKSGKDKKYKLVYIRKDFMIDLQNEI